MHIHTLKCSACSVMTAEELCHALYEGGFKGCVITNHFINGNSTADRSLSWKEIVKLYEEDYMELCEFAKQYDLDILFGIEEQVGGGLEILVYGITPEFLYSHPELRKADIKTWRNLVNDNNGLIIQSHPFRKRDYIKNPMVLSDIDGIEVYNHCNMIEENLKAEEWAKKHSEMILISGADAHRNKDGLCSKGGIETDIRIKDNDTLISVLKSGNYSLLKGYLNVL